MEKQYVIPSDIQQEADKYYPAATFANSRDDYTEMAFDILNTSINTRITACRDAYIQGRMDERTKWLPEDSNFESITGHKTVGEWKAAEKSYEATQELMIKFINEWDGYTNSTFGEAMMNAVKRVSWTDEDMLNAFSRIIGIQTLYEEANKSWLQEYKKSKGK